MAWAKASPFIIPPLIAIALYLACHFLWLPLYRRRQRYAQYLPLALAPSDEPGLVSRTRSRLREALSAWAGTAGLNVMWERRTGGRTSADFNFGDEELEEGIDAADHLDHRHTQGAQPDIEGPRRLSRDLEVGFRDDSDEEDEGGDDARRIVFGAAR